MTDPDNDDHLNRAYGLGYIAGRAGASVLSCPHKDSGPLQRRWARGYAAGKVDRTPDWVATVREWLRRVWYGDGED